MKLKQKKGKAIPGIPGATLRKQIHAQSDEEPDEILERLLESEEDDSADEDFIPQQELVNQ